MIFRRCSKNLVFRLRQVSPTYEMLHLVHDMQYTTFVVLHIGVVVSCPARKRAPVIVLVTLP
jgi:hypothetical protein